MLEFGGDFIRKMIKHNNAFLERYFSIMAPGSEHVQQTAWLYSEKILSMFQYGTTPVLQLPINLSLLMYGTNVAVK